jgi:integrase
MASLWRHPESRYFFACYRSADGRRRKVTTKTTNEADARRIADRLELEAGDERAKRGQNASLAGVTDGMQRGIQLAAAGRLDAASFRDLMNDILVSAGQERLDAVTNSAWCKTWQASKKGAVKERSRLKYDQVSRDWLAFLGRKSDKPLEIVTKGDVIAFRDQLSGEGLAPRTVNQTVKLLRGIYQDAVEQGHIGRNPFVGVSALREDNEDVKRQPFTAAEVKTLIDAAEGDWKGLTILAATTGLRLMDASRLQWRNIDAENSIIRVKTAKTGATLTLPIHPDFADWLTKQQRGIAAAPVFPTLASKGGTGKSGLSMCFKRLMERAKVAAGVARSADKDGRGRTVSKKSFHSLRHFAATQLAIAGVRPEIAHAIGMGVAVTGSAALSPEVAMSASRLSDASKNGMSSAFNVSLSFALLSAFIISPHRGHFVMFALLISSRTLLCSPWFFSQANNAASAFFRKRLVSRRNSSESNAFGGTVAVGAAFGLAKSRAKDSMLVGEAPAHFARSADTASAGIAKFKP